MAAAPSPTRVTTGEVRLSYANLLVPVNNSDDENAQPKYSTAILIPKSDTATIAKLRAAQQEALKQGQHKTFGGTIPKSWTDTIHDGDEEADLEKNPDYAGHWYLSASNKQKPGVVDRAVQQILDPDEIYSGMYAKVSLNAFAFNRKGKKGVSFGLNNVQKLRDGERLSGGSRAEDDFEALEPLDGQSLL